MNMKYNFDAHLLDDDAAQTQFIYFLTHVELLDLEAILGMLGYWLF